MGLEQRLEQLAAKGAGGVVELVDEIIAEGLRRQASDIHLEPTEGGLSVRFRQDGVLRPAIVVATEAARNAVSRVKVLAGLLTYQTDLPQEGRIDRAKVNANCDLRAATVPTVLGEKAVIRLVDVVDREMRLDELGYPADALAELERGLTTPQGVILFTGPAGSGKTTTIYAALNRIIEATGGTRHIVSVEDPVERVLPGVTQTQVKPGVGLTFARCLRSLLRQDPEVIVVGEVRDRETAGIAVEAGLTGHLVISTIHSGRAAGVFARLIEMDIEPSMLASAVMLVVAQRLVRKLCDECKRPTKEGCEAVGCEACFGTGYRGRTPIVEFIRPDRELRARVLGRKTIEDIEATAREQGMVTLADRARDAVRRGETTLAEVARVLGPET